MSISPIQSTQPISSNPIYTTNQRDWHLMDKPTDPTILHALEDALQKLRDEWLGSIQVEHQKSDGKDTLFFTCQIPVGSTAFDKVDRIIEKLSKIHPQVEFLNVLKLQDEGHA